MGENIKPASVTVRVEPDLGRLRAFLTDMLAVINKKDGMVYIIGKDKQLRRVR